MPRAWQNLAVARPMPEAAPVMSAVAPERKTDILGSFLSTTKKRKLRVRCYNRPGYQGQLITSYPFDKD